LEKFFFVVQGDEAKKAKFKEYTEKDLKTWNDHFAARLKDNKFFVGNTISLADIKFYTVYQNILGMEKAFGVEKSCLADHKNLSELLARVAATEKIAVWLKNRPVTQF